jgi:hypothetical protein
VKPKTRILSSTSSNLPRWKVKKSNMLNRKFMKAANQEKGLKEIYSHPFSLFTPFKLVCAFAKRMNPENIFIIQHVGEEFSSNEICP